MIGPLQQFLLGRPLPTSAAGHERLSKPRAMGAFGLDALSSVAYGPDEILYVVLLAGAAGARLDMPIALAIAALLAIVATSYRQTIFAYPKGGGSYTVARENLGTAAGLVAAAALMVDYLTTVAVSVTAGVAAVIAFVPALDAHRVLADVACIVLLMVINLRGVREAGAFFVLPTYIFIGSLAALLLWGGARFLLLGAPPPLHPVPQPTEAVSVFLILRAFAGGCTAMTGVEAIANGVPSFQKPESQNAAATLLILAAILGALFLGVAGLGLVVGAVPTDQANVVAQIGLAVTGGGPLFYLVQVSAAIILLLAANTSFNGFPRLAAIMASDGYLPHAFAHRGLRLAYSNGIVAIGALAIGLVVLFRGSTHALIPLFAVGVFLCFTLSQAGMVRHWLRERGRRWTAKLAINGVGALVTGIVTLVVVGAKFAEGAWIVLVLVPAIVAAFVAVHAHYAEARRELECFSTLRARPSCNFIVIPVARVDRAVVATLNYAATTSATVLGVHIAADDGAAEQVRRDWQTWAGDVPLDVVPSPYREVVAPLLATITKLRDEHPSDVVTVMLPEVVPRHWWQEPLHNQTGLALKVALLYEPGIVVTSVPTHLRE